MEKIRKYQLPDFLKGIITQEKYERWLTQKTAVHLKRDRIRGNKTSERAQYKRAIHDAVVASGGLDEYTGDPLDWKLIKKYNNADSKRLGRLYKARFADLPTVDHVGDGTGYPEFKICSWRVNDAKNDLDLEKFVDLCWKVVQHNPR